jgi:hypothetical protein
MVCDHTVVVEVVLNEGPCIACMSVWVGACVLREEGNQVVGHSVKKQINQLRIVLDPFFRQVRRKGGVVENMQKGMCP